MRFGRIRDGATVCWVRLDEAGAHTLTAAPFGGGVETGRVLAVSVPLLSPVAPGKVVCVGRNYRAHAKELGHEVPTEPLLFLKPPSAVVGPGAAIELPAQSERVEHEGELAVVMGRRVRDASPADALAAVFGYTCANDVTARDLQKRDVQFTRAKGFDTFCPLGPWIETAAPDGATTVTTRVNGVVRQHGAVGAMVFPVAELLAYITSVMTLEPGDVVLTGTPEGVGPLRDGDRVEVEVAGIGTLSNGVTLRAPAPGVSPPTVTRHSP